MQSTKYRVIGSGEAGDEKITEHFGLAAAKKSANVMLELGLDVRVIKEIRSVYGVKRPGDQPW